MNLSESQKPHPRRSLHAVVSRHVRFYADPAIALPRLGWAVRWNRSSILGFGVWRSRDGVLTVAVWRTWKIEIMRVPTNVRMSDAPPKPSNSPSACEARPPFAVGVGGWVYDADWDRVLVCSLDFPGCKHLYAESKVDSDGWFTCDCGRLGQRMEEATPARCGLMSPNDQAQAADEAKPR